MKKTKDNSQNILNKIVEKQFQNFLSDQKTSQKEEAIHTLPPLTKTQAFSKKLLIK